MDPQSMLPEYIGDENADYREVNLKFFKQIVEEVGVGVGVVGSHGKFIYINKCYADMLDRSPETLIGCSIGDVNPEFDDDRLDEYWDCFSVGETRVAETIHRTASGEEVPVLTHSTRIEIADSAVNIGTIQNITELKKNREQLDILRRVLRHDLRNRLNIVAGYVDLIERHLDTDNELCRYFEQIQTEIRHLLTTSESSRRVEKLLDKPVSDTEKWTRVVRLDQALKQAISQVQTQFPDADIRFDELSPIHVCTVEYLDQALRHLLSNAIEHNDSEQPSAELDITTTGDHVLLSITDNGPGIEDEQKERIFGHGEHDQLHHSDGFGLIFVKTVVEESGGEIWIEDNEPTGTTVKLKLLIGK